MYRWFVAYRYLFSRLITLAGLLVVTLGVAVLIVVVSVMEGFRDELESRIRGTSSDIKVESRMFIGLEDPERVESIVTSVPGVTAAAPVVETFCLYNIGGRGVDSIAEERFLLAFDFDNEMSRQQLDEALAAVPRRPKLPPFAEYFERDRKLIDDLFATQPRTIAGVFSPEWIDEGVWKPWREAAGRGFDGNLGLPAILVGVESFRREALLPGRILELTSISPNDPEPKSQRFLVAGFFKTGLYEIDAKGVVLAMDDAADFLSLDSDGVRRVSGLRVDVDDEHSSEEALAALRSEVERALEANDVLFVKTQTWREARAQLLNAVKVEKVIVSIILGVLILFAGFMIFIILTVQVVEKSRDIGVLQSLGASTWGIASIYLTIGSSLCLVGMVLGSAYGISFGIAINTVQRWIQILTGYEVFPDDVYYLDHIPVKFRVEDLVYIVAITVLASLLASVVPAVRAARRDPAEGLRHG